MDIKKAQNDASSTFHKDRSDSRPEHPINRKRKPEDLFETSSGQPAHKHFLKAPPTPTQSSHLQKDSKKAQAMLPPNSPEILRTLEMRLTQLLTSAEGDSRSISELVKVGRSALERGLPIVVTIDSGTKIGSNGEEKIVSFSQEYLKALGTENAYKSTNPVYIFFPNEKKAYYLGLTNDYFSRKHAMMGYVPAFNEIATTSDLETPPASLEIAGMGFLGLQHGIGMPINIKAAANFLRLIPEKERRETFGKLLVESLAHRQYDTALLCVPYSKGINSLDDEGHDALSNALRPGAEEVLRLLIADTTEKDLHLLAHKKKYALFANWPRAAEVLEDHAGTLGYTLDK